MNGEPTLFYIDQSHERSFYLLTNVAYLIAFISTLFQSLKETIHLCLFTNFREFKRGKWINILLEIRMISIFNGMLLVYVLVMLVLLFLHIEQQANKLKNKGVIDFDLQSVAFNIFKLHSKPIYVGHQFHLHTR